MDIPWLQRLYLQYMNIVHCGGFFDTSTHHDTSKNETIILLFVQQNASDSVSDVHIGVSKHIFLSWRLSYSQGRCEGGGSDLRVSQALIKKLEIKIFANYREVSKIHRQNIIHIPNFIANYGFLTENTRELHSFPIKFQTI